jgi:hypothetical protein
MEASIGQNQQFHWIFIQRGLWVNGAPDLRNWLKTIASFTLGG